MFRTFALLLTGIFFATPSFASCSGKLHDQTEDYTHYLDAINEVAKVGSDANRVHIRGVQDVFQLADREFSEPMDVLINIPTDFGTRTVFLPLEQIKISRVGNQFNPYHLSQDQLEIALLKNHPLEVPFLYLNSGVPNEKIIEAYIFPRNLRDKLTFVDKFTTEQYRGESHLELAEEIDEFMATKKFDHEVLNNGKISEFIQIFRNAEEWQSGFGQVTRQIPESDWDYLKKAPAKGDADQINRVLVFLRRFNFELGQDELARAQLEGIQKEFLIENIEEYDRIIDGERRLQGGFKVPEKGAVFVTTRQGEKFSRKFTVNDVPVELDGIWNGLMFMGRDAERMLTLKVEPPISVKRGGQTYQLWTVRLLQDESI